MKKNFFKGIAAITLVVMTGIVANGQAAVNGGDFSTADPGTQNIVVKNEADHSKVKAVKDVERSFKNVDGATWYNLPDGYAVRFHSDNVEYMLFFDQKGKRRFTMRSYDETKLSNDVRHIVKSTYYDYAIRLVQEIESPGKNLTYLIHLEGKTEWINLRVANGEMDEFQKFNKSE